MGCNRVKLLGVCLAVIGVTLALSSSLAGAKEQMTGKGRIDVIRALGSETGVSKLALPRGKHGVFLNEHGQLDKEKWAAEMKENGTAISSGMPVNITKITFKSDRIVFEVNGGGKKRGKWYEHLQVGMGRTTQPVAPTNPTVAYGSWVSLDFHGKVPELTPDQVKKLLSLAIDFERHSPTVLYSASVPPKFKDAIKKHEVLVGMDRDGVLSAKGAPDRKVREERDGAEQEDWIYGLPPHVLMVTFDGDTVVKVHQY